VSRDIVHPCVRTKEQLFLGETVQDETVGLSNNRYFNAASSSNFGLSFSLIICTAREGSCDPGCWAPGTELRVTPTSYTTALAGLNTIASTLRSQQVSYAPGTHDFWWHIEPLPWGKFLAHTEVGDLGLSDPRYEMTSMQVWVLQQISQYHMDPGNIRVASGDSIILRVTII